MGNADYIWEQIGVWFAARKWMIVVFGLIVLGGAYAWRKLTNAWKVFCAGIASLVIFFVLFSFFQIPFLELMGKSAGFWNFIILVVPHLSPSPSGISATKTTGSKSKTNGKTSI